MCGQKAAQYIKPRPVRRIRMAGRGESKPPLTPGTGRLRKFHSNHMFYNYYMSIYRPFSCAILG